MFVLLLRELLFIIVALFIIYCVYKWARNYGKVTCKKEELREAQHHIDHTLELAKLVPDMDVEKLKKAREKIDALLKEGRK